MRRAIAARGMEAATEPLLRIPLVLRSREPELQALLRRAQRLARTHQPLLLCGEAGCGKLALARAIHLTSRRCDAPFIALRTSQLGAGSPPPVVLPAQGSLYIDELAALPPSAQSTLLAAHDASGRAVRLLFATRHDPGTLLRLGGMAPALFARLAAFSLRLLELRRRPRDIVPLAEALAARLAVRRGIRARRFALSARRALQAHAWPGNLPELRSAVAHAFLLSLRDARCSRLPCIQRHHLPTSLVAATAGVVPQVLVLPLGLPLREVERAFIAATISACRGNRSAAAAQLSISRRSLYDRLRAAPLLHDAQEAQEEEDDDDEVLLEAAVPDLGQLHENAPDLEQPFLEQSPRVATFLEQSRRPQPALRRAG